MAKCCSVKTMLNLGGVLEKFRCCLEKDHFQEKHEARYTPANFLAPCGVTRYWPRVIRRKPVAQRSAA